MKETRMAVGPDALAQNTSTQNNIAHLLTQHATSQRVLYKHFENETWNEYTAQDVMARAGAWQAALTRAGVSAGDRVAMCMRNSVHWVAIDMAALGLGAVVVPLYVDDNAENIAFCVLHSGAKILVVDAIRQASALSATKLAAEQQLPRMICMQAKPTDAVESAERFLENAQREFTVAAIPTAQLATICYTSGTSGKPKGVMLSHANILANVRQCQGAGIATPQMIFLSLLPLSHMFERTGGYYLPLSLGCKVIYTRGIAQLPDDLKQQPVTTMFVAPRVLERLHARITQGLKEQGKIDLFNRLADAAWRTQQGNGSWLDRLTVLVLQRLMGKKIREKIAPTLTLLVSGGAALSSAVARTFVAIGLPVLQGYGMTEASPVLTVNRPERNDPESVGPALPEIEIKIAEDGELLARGANVMLGYWDNPEATAKVVDSEGWLHTGDLAEAREGRYTIKGRKKDILVLSNGEKFSPQDAELAILGDPSFEQVMLIGEGKPFITLACVTQSNDSKDLIKRANAQLASFPRWVKVRQIITTPDAWTVDTGLLTPTLKVKRAAVLEKFKSQIDRLYAEGEAEA
jgi:long-chain acyl-CoA synthetase